ncbi:unnamed protein product [Urochloa humidicola]
MVGMQPAPDEQATEKELHIQKRKRRRVKDDLSLLSVMTSRMEVMKMTFKIADLLLVSRRREAEASRRPAGFSSAPFKSCSSPSTSGEEGPARRALPSSGGGGEF